MSSDRKSSVRRIAALILPLVALPLAAQTQDPPVGVAVKMWAKGVVTGYSGSVTVSGSFLPSTPNGTDGDVTASASGYSYSPIYAVLGTGTQDFVRIEPSKTYTLYVTGVGISGEMNIVAPPGYRVIMDQMVRSRTTFEGSSNIVFEVHPLGARHPGLAGMASGIADREVEWRVSLGSLRNGDSAGDLSMLDTGMKDNWSAVFTPSALFYESLSDEVTVYRPSNVLRQIIANQVAVDIVTLNATSYEIRCYDSSQVEGSSDPRTFSGSAFVTYRVEQGATATSLKITKQLRNVTDPWNSFGVARTEYLFLSRTNSWPTCTWTRTGWSTSANPVNSLSESVVTSSGPTAFRSESVTVRVPGTSTSVLSVIRNYSVPLVNSVSVIGEVLSSETVGSTSGVTSSFTYYTDTGDFGSLGYLRSATMPGGNWVAYDYYATDVTTGTRGGRVKYRYRPYLNDPETFTQDPSLGEVTYFEYTNDIFGAPTRPCLVQTRVKNRVVAKIETDYNDGVGTTNGYPIAQTTRNEYSSSSASLVTTTRYYRDDASDAMIRGQTHSITAADGVKQSFAYQRGSWSGAIFTPGSGIGTGTAARVSVITGSSSANAGTACASVDSYVIDTVYLVDGKSTKDVTIRDSRALVSRTESHIWKTNAWQPVSYTTFAYDLAGRLTSRVGSNGATYTAVYDGGLKSSETDEAGVTTTFSYDIHGRVSIATRTGSGVIAAVSTKYTYDAAGHVTKEEVGYGQSGVITTQRQFDDAGRTTQVTPPGNYGILTYSYDVANRTQTTTRADSSTVITTDFRDGRRASTTGTGTVAEYHTFDVETDGRGWHQINVGTSNSARWQKSWKDWLGRGIKSEHPGFTGQANIVEESVFEAGTGHLVKTTKTGYAATLLQYNYLGQVTRSGLDVTGNGALDLASSDRISETNSYLESYGGAWWMRTDTRTYPKLGLNTAIVTSSSRTRLTGHAPNRLSESQGIDAEGNVTTQTVDVNRGARTAVATTSRSGLPTAMVENSLNGVSISLKSFDDLTATKAYDSFLRPSSVTDSRGNTTATTYVTGTAMVQSVVNQAGNTSVTTYDSAGRVSTQRDPKNFYIRYAYNLRGQLVRQWGDGTMSVEYGYDSTYGARTTMSTFRGGTGWDGTAWPANPGTADTTTWTYDGPSGLLTGKTDGLGRTANQTYNQRGQTATRELARDVPFGANIGQRMKTTYSYDSATGELLSQAYNDDTPSVTYNYGRTGQVETVSDFTGLRDLVYDTDKPWRLTAEVGSAFYGGRVLTRLYNESGTIGRVRGFQLGESAGSNSDLEQTFGFTTAGRFETITSNRQSNPAGARTFRYAYLPNSALLQSLSIDGSHPFTSTRSYETQRDVITGLDSKWSTTLRTGYAYTTDERGQRSKVVQSGDAYGDYGDVTSQQFAYNGRGELTSAIGYLGSDISLSNQQLPGRRHEYDYDSAGNRHWSNRTGSTALRDDYTTNALNQYATRENNTVPVSGTADAAVVVQGGTLAPVAAGRKGKYWNDEVTVNNNAEPLAPNPWRGPLTIFTAKAGTSGSPDVYKADSRMAEIGARWQTFDYDFDGNMTSDGLVDYQYDAENRLVRMETSLIARDWNFPHRLLEFRYDYMGRRVQKRVIDVTLNREISCRRFLYDGWNLVAEYTAPNGSICGALIRSYTWGLDIVSTMSSAGGVGALLQVADHPSGKTYLPTYDGNGNIAALIDASSGALAAAYEYSPYGEPLRAQTFDSTVADNAFRFSTKWTDVETGLVYYGHRFYEPKNGRFINRDPIEEAGGINLYGFCGNNAINRWDVLGMSWFVEFTSEETYKAFATDSHGNSGVWNFSSRADAERWAQAWEDHNMSVVGDRAVTGAYLHPDPNGSAPANAGAPDFSLQILSFSGWDPPSDDYFELGWGWPMGLGWFAPNGDIYLYQWDALDPFYIARWILQPQTVWPDNPSELELSTAVVAINQYNADSIKSDEEFGGLLYSYVNPIGIVKYAYTGNQLTRNSRSLGNALSVAPIPDGLSNVTVYGWWHTHGNGVGSNGNDNYFSRTDVRHAQYISEQLGGIPLASYVGLPNRSIKRMDWDGWIYGTYTYDPTRDIYLGPETVWTPPN